MAVHQADQDPGVRAGPQQVGQQRATRNVRSSAVPSTRTNVPYGRGAVTVASTFPVNVDRTVSEAGWLAAGVPVAVSAT